MRSPIVLVSVFAAAALSSCGSSGSVTAAQACNDVASARCNRVMACSPTDLAIVYGDMTTCVKRQALSCTTGLAAPETGDTPANLETCANKLPIISCADYFRGNLPASCLAPMGMVANGGGCGYGGQCQSSFCPLTSNSICGTCQAASTAGSPCTESTCSHGFKCVPSTGMCEVPELQGQSCDASHPCATLLSCVISGGTGTCQPNSESAGTACDPVGRSLPACDFTAGLLCDPTSKTCTMVQLQSASQPCGAWNGNNYELCTGGARCVSGSCGSTCVAPAADGATCDTTNGPPCLFPARCVTSGSSTSGTCTIPTGMSCP